MHTHNTHTHTHTHKGCRLLKAFPLLGVLRESFKTKRSYRESSCILKQFAMAIQSQAHPFLLCSIVLCSADTVFYKLQVCSKPVLSDDGQQFLIRNYLIKVYILFFQTACHCTLIRLQGSINIAFKSTGKLKNLGLFLYFNIIFFIVMVQNQTHIITKIMSVFSQAVDCSLIQQCTFQRIRPILSYAI